MREKGACVQVRIPHKPESAPMDLVGPRLGHCVHYTRGTISVIHGHVAGLDGEFLDGVRKGEGEVEVEQGVHVLSSVQCEPHVVIARTVYTKRLLSPDDRAIIGVSVTPVIARHHSGYQKREIRGIPPIQRKLVDARLVDRFPNRRRARLNLTWGGS